MAFGGPGKIILSEVKKSALRKLASVHQNKDSNTNMHGKKIDDGVCLVCGKLNKNGELWIRCEKIAHDTRV